MQREGPPGSAPLPAEPPEEVDETLSGFGVNAGLVEDFAGRISCCKSILSNSSAEISRPK